ncbi:NGFI-A-binding protein homolog isoform X2 [Microplitis mediator]|uniref:NGFI-A-binding protein homolog isoform X2 n=1 Tax=Microplitis mediator TaxID=375433 RepID=UPI002554DB44|nr:NGFI-A-binding protein homolog isoform X2 [Microplitis mediator]
METRVCATGSTVSGGTETPSRGVATPSPVPSLPSLPASTGTTATTSSASVGIAASAVLTSAASMQSSSSPVVLPSPPIVSSHASLPKILSRNVNGTLVQTSVPQNEAELQLYRVMQRASLLGYYDTLLEMGGDDVQQLCDAGEEEFLEIMALVGMASKPLHVRRLQKALQEWITNPSLFQTPVVPSNTAAAKSSSTSVPIAAASPRTHQTNSSIFPLAQTSPTTPFSSTTHVPLTPLPCRSVSPVTPVTVIAPAASTFRHSPSPNTPLAYTGSHSPGVLQVGTCESSCGSGTTPSPSGGGGAPPSPTQVTPTLLPSQVQRLADAAERLACNLRPLDPKPHNVKKKICKNLEIVMAMPDNDPRRMDEIRKYAAIYGRFDCKRKPEKPLTLHEVSVNEAAAQICRFVPALLTRRDELFPLARRVVRDSGYHYSKSQFLMTRRGENGDEETDKSKRQHLDADAEGEDTSQAELDLRCTGSDINNTLRRHVSSSPVWRKKSNNGGFITNIEEVSDTDSQFSFSNDESLHDINELETDNTDKESDFNLKVIASRGDNIIAVANPALMECNHPTIKKEPEDEKSIL